MYRRIIVVLAVVIALLAGAGIYATQASASTLASTRITGFNASPEPIAAGDDLTIVGKLERHSSTWVPMTSAPVQIQFKPTGKTYKPFKSVITDGLGNFKYVVPVSVSGTYRAVYAGSSRYASFTGLGDSVALAPTKVVAVTQVVKWPDTDTSGGLWAQDAFKRTLTIQRGAKVAGGYVYGFTVVDSGGFVSGKDVTSPNVSTEKLHGVVRGLFDGGISGSFVSSSRYLDAARVPLTEDGSDGKVSSSSQWGKLALPTGATVVSWDSNAPYSWVYEAPGTCETFTQATEGNVGNILGVNACE